MPANKMLAVKMYQHVKAPLGVPKMWPAKVIEVAPNVKMSSHDGWHMMTVEEYNSYRAAYRSEWDKYSKTFLDKRERRHKGFKLAWASTKHLSSTLLELFKKCVGR